MTDDTEEIPKTTTKSPSETSGSLHQPNPISTSTHTTLGPINTSRKSSYSNAASGPSKPPINPLQAQADRLKLSIDPFGLSVAKRNTAVPNNPANTPISPNTPHDFMSSDPFASDPFASHRTNGNNPFSPPIDPSALSLYVDTGEIPSNGTTPRRMSSAERKMSKEWDASKVPPSRFQRPEGSIFATPGSRGGNIDRDVQQRYMDKLKEKGWDRN